MRRRRPDRVQHPVAAGQIVTVEPPEHMSPAAQEVWPHVTAALLASGVVRDVDLLAVEMLCEAYSDFSQADQEIRNNWIVQEREDGTRVPIISRYTYKVDNFGNRIATLHPAYAAKREASNAIRAWLNELGMTPAARARIVGSVHGLPAGERTIDGELGPAEHSFADIPAEDREALRTVLQRRLTGSAPVVEEIEHG